jgi:hypothetical protein
MGLASTRLMLSFRNETLALAPAADEDPLDQLDDRAVLPREVGAAIVAVAYAPGWSRGLGL